MAGLIGSGVRASDVGGLVGGAESEAHGFQRRCCLEMMSSQVREATDVVSDQRYDQTSIEGRGCAPPAEIRVTDQMLLPVPRRGCRPLDRR